MWKKLVLLLFGTKPDNSIAPVKLTTDGSLQVADGADTANPPTGTGARGWLQSLYARFTSGTPLPVSVSNPTANPETGLAKETTLAEIAGDTDALANLDVLLSTRATEATLALIRSKTDNLNLALTALRDAITGAKSLADVIDAIQSQTISGSVDVTDRVGRLLGHVTVDNPATNPETGLNKEATQLLIKAKTDFLDIALSTRATESTQLLVKGVLDAVKTKTDNLDITLSSLRDALKGGKTLADIVAAIGATDVTDRSARLLGHVTVDNPTETGLNKEATQLLVKAKTDNLDIALSVLRDALRGTGNKTLTDVVLAIAALTTIDVTDRAGRALGHVAVDNIDVPLSTRASASKQDDQTVLLQALNGLLPKVPYNYVSLSPPSQPTSIVFKSGGASGTVVGGLTITYSGSDIASVLET